MTRILVAVAIVGVLGGALAIARRWVKRIPKDRDQSIKITDKRHAEFLDGERH